MKLGTGNYGLPYVGFTKVPPNRIGQFKKERRDNSDLEYDKSDEMYRILREKWIKEHGTESTCNYDDSDDEDSSVEDEDLDLTDVINKAVQQAQNRFVVAAITSEERTKMPPMPVKDINSLLKCLSNR